MLRYYQNRQKIFQSFLLNSEWYVYVIENTIGLYYKDFIRSYVACDPKETFFDFTKAFDDKILLMLMLQLKMLH